VIKAHNLINIKTRPRHPESNETNNDYGDNYLVVALAWPTRKHSTGAVPASARIELDPVIINGGLSFHF
jgi:hypothetical protein